MFSKFKGCVSLIGTFQFTLRGTVLGLSIITSLVLTTANIIGLRWSCRKATQRNEITFTILAIRILYCSACGIAHLFPKIHSEFSVEWNESSKINEADALLLLYCTVYCKEIAMTRTSTV